MTLSASKALELPPAWPSVGRPLTIRADGRPEVVRACRPVQAIGSLNFNGSRKAVRLVVLAEQPGFEPGTARSTTSCPSGSRAGWAHPDSMKVRAPRRRSLRRRALLQRRAERAHEPDDRRGQRRFEWSIELVRERDVRHQATNARTIVTTPTSASAATMPMMQTPSHTSRFSRRACSAVSMNLSFAPTVPPVSRGDKPEEVACRGAQDMTGLRSTRSVRLDRPLLGGGGCGGRRCSRDCGG
jgi:hypothetical protein